MVITRRLAILIARDISEKGGLPSIYMARDEDNQQWKWFNSAVTVVYDDASGEISVETDDERIEGIVMEAFSRAFMQVILDA